MKKLTKIWNKAKPILNKEFKLPFFSAKVDEKEIKTKVWYVLVAVLIAQLLTIII